MFLEAVPNQYLFAARLALIFWTRAAVWPLEIAYDSVVGELNDRGHKVQ